MATKKMTLEAAWRWLAAKWLEQVRAKWTIPSVGSSLGVCPCIDQLESEGRITPENAATMLESVERERRKKGTGNFVWPPNLAGARSRAAFCSRMARECASKSKKRRELVKAKGG